MPAGHEVEFDRIIVDELKLLGHEVCFFVPEKFPFKLDYGVSIVELAGGEAISYAGAGGLKKLWLSLQRERRRQRWFADALLKAQQGLCDMIIVPTSTYRYTRALLKSGLQNSPVPVVFIVHGINPKEKDNFIKAAKTCMPYKNIHFAVLTLRNDLAEAGLSNVSLFAPPVYTPRDLPVQPAFKVHEPLRLGFFGQYRREKNLEFFLQAFQQADFKVPVELLIQGATAKTQDAEEFLRLAEKYKNLSSVTFLHKSLIGKEWQQAILDSDVILMPYAAERYRYHWSAMLFTAIGYYKPVLQSPELNPEVLAKYNIGEAVVLDSVERFANQLECFVNSFSHKAKNYQSSLEKINIDFSPSSFAKNVVGIAEFKKAKPESLEN